jgi:hypothetical protein
MKKPLIFLFCFFLPFFSLQSAHAEEQIIQIIGAPHQNFSGVFENDELAQELTPAGKLGRLVYVPFSSKKTWLIDPALVDEVVAMTQPYLLINGTKPTGTEIAKAWLDQLKRITVRNNVVALAYGNPDTRLANALAPNELKLYYNYGQNQLQIILGRTVQNASTGNWGLGKSKLDGEQVRSYSTNRKNLTKLIKVVNDPALTLMRAKLACLLSPTLNKSEKIYFSKNADVVVGEQMHKLRITPGKYQITTESAKLPVTVINEFPVDVFVAISMVPKNSRVRVENIGSVLIPAQSKKQLEIQLNVVAPGQTVIEAKIKDPSGVQISETSILQINSTVIDKRVTWFTTGAAILLLLAAIAQSVRRVRKGRINENQ